MKIFFKKIIRKATRILFAVFYPVFRIFNRIMSEVSELDTSAIEDAINEERWDKSIISRIKKFLKFEVKKSVTISKLQERER